MDAVFSKIRKETVSGECKNTDKKENKIVLIYKEIQNGAVAKSYVISVCNVLYVQKKTLF
jgi:hypothetical protein